MLEKRSILDNKTVTYLDNRSVTSPPLCHSELVSESRICRHIDNRTVTYHSPVMVTEAFLYLDCFAALEMTGYLDNRSVTYVP